MQEKTTHFTNTARFLLLGILGSLLLFPTCAPDAVGNAFRICRNTLIPSLFPTFVLCDLLVSLRVENLFWRKTPLDRLLGVSPRGACVFLIGILAGFPHAARMATGLFEQGSISKEEAERLIAFSSIAGPSFLIGGVGIGMLHSAKIGLYFYLVQLAAALLTALTLRIVQPMQAIPKTTGDTPPPPPFLPALAASIGSGALAMLGVCAAVTFFSTLRSLLARILPGTGSALLLSGFLEISSCAADCIALLPSAILFPALSVLFAWSGCSVHAQIALVTKGKLSLRLYLISKLLLCFFSFLLSIFFHP